ncbi:hypothetical protein D3C85_1077890 [compost metagenome]
MAAMASPIPVFPEVPSIMVPPGFSLPLFSASSIILTAIRSLMELPGLVVSILARIVPGTFLVIVFNFTNGVFPIVSKILLYHMLQN